MSVTGKYIRCLKSASLYLKTTIKYENIFQLFDGIILKVHALSMRSYIYIYNILEQKIIIDEHIKKIVLGRQSITCIGSQLMHICHVSQ